MKNKNVFEKNAKIPDIVQQKANAAFREIYTRQDEPDTKPQKTYKPTRATVIKIASTVVAAAITVAVLSFAISYFAGQGTENPESSESSESSENPAITATAVITERFSIRVCAAELKPKAPLPVNLDVSKQTWGYGVDWEGNANYQVNLPISVEGENISSVTFKAGNSVIETVSIDCPSIVKSGSTKTLPDFRSTYVDGYDMAGQPIGKTEVGYYDSFTADYDTLQNSKYLLNICNYLKDRTDLYYVLAYAEGDDNTCASVTYLLKDAELTVEVTFKDGTTASRTLGFFADKYTATAKDTDGIEYTYTTMQIFCYDKNSADDATKQLISNQIARAIEMSKDAEAKHPIDDIKTNQGEPVDETEATVSTETTASTETTVSTEPTISAKPTISATPTVSPKPTESEETSASTESTAATEPTVSTEETKSTEEVSSTENTDNVNSGN